MKSYYDAIIVGGGPAGATAGLTLARQGASVLILDRARFPRPKLCGGLLTQKTVFALERLFGRSRRDLVADGIINHFSNAYEIYHRDRLVARGEYSYPFHFVDRRVLDSFLLDKAREAGAEVVEGCKAVSVDPALPLVACADGSRLRAAYLIGADGVNSVVRRSCPTDRRAWNRDLAATVELELDPMSLPEPVSHPVLYGGFNDAGYAWLFPHKDKVVLGMGGIIRANRSLTDSFRVFLLHLGVTVPADRRLQGHLLPYGNFLSRPVFGRTLLAGDAGGFVEPLFGEGIFYALRTGEAAAQAVLLELGRAGAMEKSYLAELARDVYPELIYAKRLRKLVHFCERYVSCLPLKVFVNSCESRLLEMVHGVRSYRWLRKRPPAGGGAASGSSGAG